MKCSKCYEDKPQEDFLWDDRNRVYHKSCRLCINKKLLSQDEYSVLFKKQNGTCRICGEREKVKVKKTGIAFKLAVDHCHSTGKVRGLLCNSCNLALGKFKDNPKRLLEAYAYLTEENLLLYS